MKEIVLMRRYLFPFLVASFVLVACEGARNNTSWSNRDEGTEVVPSIKPAHNIDAAVADSASADSAATDSSQAEH
jgi:uncharacterized protein YcfL